MKNFIQDGTRMRHTATAVAASGSVILVGNRVGVATADIAIGATGDLAMLGVFSLPKASADNFVIGAQVYWDNTSKVMTSVTTGNTLAGYVAEPASAATTSAKICINA